MAKKVTKPKRPTAEDVLNIQGDHIPAEVAEIFHTYYLAFLVKGFTSEQAFKLTQQVAAFYLS